MIDNEYNEYNPALGFEDTDYYSEDEVEPAEEEEEPFEWTPDVCAYEVQDYGDDATQFVADQAPFFSVPNPIIYVDGVWWNACEYSAYLAKVAYQADLESKRVAHAEKLAWQARMRRGLPTESRLGRIKRIQSEKEAKNRKFTCAANAKQSPKFGTRSANRPTRKGKRGVVVADAKVVSERRKLRRREAKAAQCLRACTTPQVAVPILEPVAYIPEPEHEDEQEVVVQEKQEIQAACSAPKTWIPVTRAEPIVSKSDEGIWITVKKPQDRKLKQQGFVTKGTRGRAARCTMLDLSKVTTPTRPVKKERPSPPPCPVGWVFTHPCMDLRPHITEDTPLCRHFQFGSCNFGSNCKFRHTYGACKFGARCTRAGCKRAHPAKKSTPRPRPSPTPTSTPTPTPTSTPTPSPTLTSSPSPEPIFEFMFQVDEPAPATAPQASEPDATCDFKCVLQESGFTIEVDYPEYMLTPPGPPLGPPPPLVFPRKIPDDTSSVTSTLTISSTSSNRQTVTCRNWADGNCTYGSKCRFAHFNIPQKTCKFWELGKHCKHGSKCRFKHG